MRPWLVLLAVLEALLIVALLVMRGGGDASPQLVAPDGPAVGHEAVAAPAFAAAPRDAATGGPRDGEDAQPQPARTAAPAPEPAGTEDLLGLTLFGTVQDEAGKPVKDAWITVSRGKPNEQWNAQRTPKGYCIAGLEPGRIKLTAHSDNFLALEKHVDLVAGQRLTRLDLVLQPATVVRVKVLTPEGQPFSTAFRKLREEGQQQGWRPEPSAIATVEPPPRRFEGTSPWELSVSEWRPGRDANDKELPKEYLGELLLKKPPPLYVSLVFAATVLDTARVEPGQGEVEFRLVPASVKGMLGSVTARFVRDADGQPIEGLNVQLGDGGFGFGGFGQARTDRDGKVRLLDQQPGTPRLMASGGKDVERWERAIVIESGKETDVGTVRLRGPAPIRGKVLDSAGKPVSAQLRLNAVEAADGGRPTEPRQVGSSDAEGEFTLAQVPRGRFVLRAVDGRTKESGWTVVDNASGPVEGVRVDLRAGATLTLRSKPEARGWSFVVVSGDGLPITSGRLWNQEQQITLPSGSYALQLWQNKRMERSVPVALTAAGTAVDVP